MYQRLCLHSLHRIVPRDTGCPRWPIFGRFQPSCRPRWSWMGLNYPSFIGNQLLLNTFCSTCNPRARGCPRWPGFGLFPASMRSVRVEVGLKLSVFHLGSIPIQHFGFRIDPRARRWPRWPSFSRFRPPRRPRGSKSGVK